MRNIVIERITIILVEYPELQLIMDISPVELQELSNAQLVDLLVETEIELLEQQG